MKKKTKLGSHGRNRRKSVQYTDEYIEAFSDEDFYEDAYGEDPAERGESRMNTSADFDDDDEYIVAYSSEDTIFGAYTSEEMKEYEAEYAELQEYEAEEYEDPQEYEAEEYEDPQEYEAEEYEDPQEYEAEEYEDPQEYEAEEYEDPQEYEAEEYEDPQEYEAEEYEDPQECTGPGEYESVGYIQEDYESLYSTKEINLDIPDLDDYEEDTESYYQNVGEGGETEYYASDEYYDDAYVNEYVHETYFDEAADMEAYDCEGYYDEEYYEEEYDSEEYDNEEYYSEDYYEDEYYNDGNEECDEDSFDIGYGGFDADYERDAAVFETDESEEPADLWQRVKMRLGHLTAFDAVLASTGVIVLAASIVIGSIYLQSRNLNTQIEALAPLGSELMDMGIVGDEGLLAMADAALSGNFAEEADTETTESVGVVDEPESTKVNVNFVSVEKDLKIRFTDVRTGELITGTVFEVTLTNAKGKQLILKDEDMDGIIYAQNVNAGVFDAIVTSTDKYKFPTVAQQVTVKDKVEYVVINVQDEVKTEKQIDVAVEDTEKNAAVVEEEVLKDTVEWVESTKTPVSGSESYLLVDKSTIADPSQVSKAASRMLFDALKVSVDPASATLMKGSSIDLKGTEFTDTKDGDVEYQYTKEWKSSDEKVATVSDGKVTAKETGEAVITYTVTKKTITTTYESKEPTEEITEISVADYEALSDEEKAKCTPIKGTGEGAAETDLITGYQYKKVKAQEQEKKTSETTETASAECKIKVEAPQITSGALELTKSADSCAVGATLTVKPAKLVYTKQDGSTETITDTFPSIVWESGDKSIATVGADGTVTGVKAGKVHITGKVTGVKGADGNELDIKCSVEISITEQVELTISLDRTKDVSVGVGEKTTLVATVSNYKSDAGVAWRTSDAKVATVDEKGVVTGVAVGSVTITAATKEKDSQGKEREASCVVTVKANAASDTTTKLKDKNGNQIYIKNADGSYREAVYADYFNNSEFYIAAQASYVYTGWQTIDGKTYYYDKNGNVVTGTQIIQGVTYNFGSDGAIATTVNGSTFGIDVSRHNGKIDWNAVKASGVDYVIIRCGYRGSATGALIEDQNFKTNIAGASAAGLKVGVYVFSQAVNEVEAVKEASLAVSLVKGYNLTYPIFIDTEASGGRADKIDKATRTAVVNAFCQTVASAGYKPGIYASKTWFEDKLNMGAVASCKIWLAQYSAAPTYKGKYDMWQYSSKGKISGISTDVDLNYSYLGY